MSASIVSVRNPALRSAAKAVASIARSRCAPALRCAQNMQPKVYSAVRKARGLGAISINVRVGSEAADNGLLGPEKGVTAGNSGEDANLSHRLFMWTIPHPIQEWKVRLRPGRELIRTRRFRYACWSPRGASYGLINVCRRTSAGHATHTTLAASTPATIQPCRCSPAFGLPNSSSSAPRNPMTHSTTAYAR